MSSSNTSDAISSAQAGSSKGQTASSASFENARRPPPGPPRDRAGNIIKRPDYRPLSDLIDNSIYLLTFLLYDEYKPDKYHWGLYVHFNKDDGGMKLHVDDKMGGWLTDHGVTKGAMTSNRLVGAIRIAEFSPSQKDSVLTIIRAEDTQLNDVKPFSCSIWVARACSRLRDEGLMHYKDWTEVRREVLDFSNTHWLGSAKNNQPRPLAYSKVCGLSC